MNGCRWYRRGECRLHRHGRRPSHGVCRICELHKTNRILGLGDLVRLALSSVPKFKKMKSGCGCQGRQNFLNKYVPLRITKR